MFSVLSILFISLLLIFFEFFIPGGIVGLIGASGILFSIYKFSEIYNDMLHIIFFASFCIASIFFVMKLALKKIQNSPSTGVYNNDDQEGFIASEFEQNLFGKEGVTVSDLKPSGYIEVEGKRYQALSKSGYISKGDRVLVQSGQGGHLNVLQIKE
ncbi:Uncharacterized protein AB751O23_AI_00210 [Chlamydiales bacterium SCGC AB-751-O23]|jgi:membrane-bound ClpP family serine protease|nr:Uncharacterized protein AB751O23_AI_00210 [Chlamydiales bacterium SCGC AB-751-O23]